MILQILLYNSYKIFINFLKYNTKKVTKTFIYYIVDITLITLTNCYSFKPIKKKKKKPTTLVIIIPAFIYIF